MYLNGRSRREGLREIDNNGLYKCVNAMRLDVPLVRN